MKIKYVIKYNIILLCMQSYYPIKNIYEYLFVIGQYVWFQYIFRCSWCIYIYIFCIRFISLLFNNYFNFTGVLISFPQMFLMVYKYFVSYFIFPGKPIFDYWLWSINSYRKITIEFSFWYSFERKKPSFKCFFFEKYIILMYNY